MQMSLRAVEPQNKGHLIEQRYHQQDKLDATISGKHCDGTENKAPCNSYRIFNSERVKVRRAFQAGVDDVGDEGGSEKAEEPFAA